MKNEIIREFGLLLQKDPQYDFGSCQYDTAALTYGVVLEVVKKFGFEEVLKAFGIETFTKRTEKELLSILPTINDIDTDEEIAIKSIRKYFEITRAQAWDLWSAYIPVEDVLDTEDELTTLDLPTFGPILNQYAQSDNFQVGFGCAVLTLIYDIEVDNFAGFDT